LYVFWASFCLLKCQSGKLTKRPDFSRGAQSARSRSFRGPDGSFNLFFAKQIKEVALEKEFIITLRKGWRWSDGAEITADDAIAARTIQGDADLGGNRFHCSEIDGEPITYEKLGRYRYRITLPKPRVNALADTCGLLPAHIFMPVYERDGAAGVRALWGERTDPQDIVSGGPYVAAEILPGERVVMARNALYGASVRAADGSSLPGPDRWVFLEMQDGTAELAAVVTGQLDLYQPTSLEQVQTVREALERGSIPGKLYANLGPETLWASSPTTSTTPTPASARCFAAWRLGRRSP
jgi:peptide/nickel transport system substrate-binding protein